MPNDCLLYTSISLVRVIAPSEEELAAANEGTDRQPDTSTDQGE